MHPNILLQYVLPKHILSRIVGKIANCRVSFIKNLFIKIFCSLYQINMDDAIEPNPFNYPTFNDFFTRKLRPDARKIHTDPNTITSPVDGKIWQIGNIDSDQIINAKGHGFTLEQLVASQEEARLFQNGNFAVLYLAPHDYHRIHMPTDGKLISMRYVPGNLFSVNPKVAEHIPDLFAKNERVVTLFDTPLGKMGMILVGATIVGSIETVWDGIITPSHSKEIFQKNYPDQNIDLLRGNEMGSFRLGSTVILLFPEKIVEWKSDLAISTLIQMGQELGTKITNDH